MKATSRVLIVVSLAIWNVLVHEKQMVIGTTSYKCNTWRHSVHIELLYVGDRPQSGVSVMGANVTNNGYIAIDLIGVRLVNNPASVVSTAVLCHTNLPSEQCCGSRNGTKPTSGNWFFPNGSTVLGFNTNGGEDGAPFFARNRGENVVRLYRVDNETAYPPQRGQFCCVIPYSQSSTVNRTYCVNICIFLSHSL